MEEKAAYGAPRPSRLLGLPTEILVLILGDFCQHCRSSNNKQQQESETLPVVWDRSDRQALYSACLVSRRLRDIAQPILYHDCILGHDLSYHGSSANARPLVSFLRTVTKRPELAALVCTCRIAQTAVHWPLSSAYPIQSEGVLVQDASQALSLKLDDLRDVFQRLPYRSSSSLDRFSEAEMLMVLLLACLPNLSSLYGSHLTNLAIPREALRAAGVNHLRLRNITYMSCGGHLYKRHFLDGLFEMAASTLETLTLEYTDGALRGVRPATTNLRIVRLKWAIHSKAEMEYFFAACTTGLEEFTFRGCKSASCDGYCAIGYHCGWPYTELRALRL